MRENIKTVLERYPSERGGRDGVDTGHVVNSKIDDRKAMETQFLLDMLLMVHTGGRSARSMSGRRSFLMHAGFSCYKASCYKATPENSHDIQVPKYKLHS
ncbi:hypothetical protein QJS04_geneDACA008304 [Acorus gramineus]|uniref:Uncharacterized protein n=1 Tax=Acorus gramineus TaxID=55184 RepID=A0AAV9AUQ5_ACOGR|nr:hypothetical protein QJS04_geneDACA008304 [Acorus gramineus]